MQSKIQLLLLKGLQDKDIEKQVITPSVIRLSNKKQNNFKEHGDLIKIKGFITDFSNIDKLEKLNLTIWFGDYNYKIPFSFLLKYNNNNSLINKLKINSNDGYFIDYFIEFPHDILLKHKIPLISLTYSPFNILIKELDDNMIVDMVLDTYILDVDARKEAAITDKIYNIKSIQEFKIKSVGTSINELYKFYEYSSDITPELLTQGIIINYPKNQIQKLLIIFNNTIKCLDYDNKLINIYGEDIGENLTYFGFNIEENFISNNQIGCINMSIIDKVNVNVEIKILRTDEEIIPVDNEQYVKMYTISSNTINYKMGLCGRLYA